MRNNNNGLRVVNGGLSNEEYQARQLRKEDLEIWGDYREWDESIVEHILYYADDYEVERFMEYLEEDEMSEANGPQLYAVNSDESYDEEIIGDDDIIAESKQSILGKVCGFIKRILGLN